MEEPKDTKAPVTDEEGKEWEDQPVSADIIEAARASLPEDYEIDIMAAELLEHLSNYRRARVALRTARSNGDHQRAEQMGKLLTYSRNCAALIEHEYPRAVPMMGELAQVRAKLAARQRKAALVEGEGE